jgi:hypothetical protein
MTRPVLPSFSIIIESENLAVEDSVVLFSALDTLCNQTVSMSDANEAFLVNSGKIPPTVEARIKAEYPSLRIHMIDAESTYYEAKQNTVALTTGEVIVFCDCDCRYSPEWLESLITPYADSLVNAEIVTGETSIELKGFHSYFIALAWCFPMQSHRKLPYQSNGYAANNISFRRTLLDKNPMPTDLQIYRGNCSLHARHLIDQGVDIWKAPRARAFHPTLRPAHAPARFFMWGHHETRVCMAKYRGLKNPILRASNVFVAIARVTARRMAMPFIRWPSLLRQRPASAFYIPPLLCYVAVANILFVLGIVATITYPSMSLLGLAKRLELSEHHSNV